MNFDGVDSRIMGVKISLICESTSILNRNNQKKIIQPLLEARIYWGSPGSVSRRATPVKGKKETERD